MCELQSPSLKRTARPTQLARALAPLWALSALAIGSQPAISLPALSAFLITLKHIHIRAHENRPISSAQGRRGKRNQRTHADRDLWVVLILELT